jgi:hypothetical protein
MMSRVAVSVVLLSATLIAAGSGTLVSAADAQSVDGAALVGVPSARQAAPGPSADSGNGTDAEERSPQVNPRSYDEDPDLGELQRWLVGRLIEQVRNGTRSLSREEYSRANQVLGERYRATADRYSAVARATVDGDDDRLARRFRRIGEQQREYLSALNDYRRIRLAYRRADEGDQDRRATRLARRLVGESERLSRERTDLLAQYRVVNDTVAVDLRPSIRRVENTTERTIEEGAAATRRRLVTTTIQLRLESESASFREPVRVGGRLVAANGTALADRPVTLRLGNRTQTVMTDGAGEFVTSLRPFATDRVERTLVARFDPASPSPYLNTTAEVAVIVEPTSVRVTLTDIQSTLSFDRRVRTTGRVMAGADGVPGVNVVVSLAGTRIGRARTGPDGRFSSVAPLPADVPDGSQVLRASVGDKQSTETAAATSRVTVTQTETVLRTEAKRASDEAVLVVTGQLRTSDGRPVADRPVGVIVDGTLVRQLRTNRTGGFNARVDPPDGDVSVGRTNVTVVHEAEGTNLESVRAVETVMVNRDTDDLAALVANGRALTTALVERANSRVLTPLGVAVPWWLLVTIVGLATVLAGVVVRQRRAEGGPITPADGSDGVSLVTPWTGPKSTEGVGDEGSRPAESPTSFTASRERLREGYPEVTVELAYRTARRRLADKEGVASDGTAGQFLASCERAGMNAQRLDAVRRLVDAYERAVFSERRTDRSAAAAAIEAAVEATDGDEREREPLSGGEAG